MSRKLVIVGDGMVGKTALIQSFVNGRFENDYTPTVFETNAEDIHLADGRSVTLSLWDTGGQEEFDQIRQLAYPGASVILLCYAIDCETSLNNIIHTWNKEVRHYCPVSPVILVGCKSDLRSLPNRAESRSHRSPPTPSNLIDPNLAVDVQKQIGAIVNIECSAINRSNVVTVFHLAAAAVLDSMKPQRPSMFGLQQGYMQKKISMTRKSNRASKSSLCCLSLQKSDYITR